MKNSEVICQESLSVSVIIPTLNGGKVFKDLLKQLSLQSIKINDLLVVDSESDDDTCLIAEKFGAKVISISRGEFDHGATRNMAAKQVTGNVLLFFTQDAVPVRHDCIQKLIEPLLCDSSIAISYGRQLPNADASLSATALRMFNYPNKSSIREYSDKKRLGLKTAFVSNSCAAYRRSCLENVKYFPNNLIFGEDTCAVGRLLQKGHKIAYAAEAKVLHSHNYSLRQEFRRSFDIGVLHKIEHWLPGTYGRAEGEGIKYIKYELAMIMEQNKLHLLPLFFCRNLTKIIGYKLGSKYDTLPQWLVPKLSMNSGWWYRNRKR